MSNSPFVTKLEGKVAAIGHSGMLDLLLGRQCRLQ